VSRARQVEWALLPDDVLRKLGEKDSLNGASAAITEEMRAWGLPSGDAFVISHLSVLNREDEDAICHIDKLARYHAAVAFGDEPLASTADRLSCALALLRASHKAEYEVTEDMAVRAQQVVCNILLEHPVLLHPRLVMSMRRREATGCDYFPLLAVMIATRRATLPSSALGVDPERLKRFASSKLSAAPFKRLAPKKCWAASQAVGRRKEEVNCAGNVLLGANSSFGAPSPAMLTSMLELNRLRGYDADFLARDGSGNQLVQHIVRSTFARALGMHRHHMKTGFHQPQRFEGFLEEVRLSRILQSARVRDGLEDELAQHIFVKAWDPLTRNLQEVASLEMVLENTNIALDALVQAEMTGTRGDGASWLVQQWLRDDKPGRQVATPSTDMQGAIGFLAAAVAAGLTLDELRPTRADGNRFNRQTWENAYEVFVRQHAMEQVLSRAPAEPVTSPSESAPRRRMRAV
jgi:hypothetical protein